MKPTNEEEGIARLPEARQTQNYSSYAAATGSRGQEARGGRQRGDRFPVVSAATTFTTRAQDSFPTRSPAPTANSVWLLRQPPEGKHVKYRGKRSAFQGQPEVVDPVEEIANQKLKALQKEPDEGVEIYVKGYVPWPEATLPIAISDKESKDDLDAIRIPLSCHIVYDKILQAFKVFAKESDIVESAVVAIREKLHQKEYVAPEPLKVFLARIPENHTLRLLRKSVKQNALINEVGFKEGDTLVQLERVSGAYIPSQTEWQAWTSKQINLQIGVLKHSVLDRIADLRSTGDGLSLKVRLGICVFRNFIWVEEAMNICDIPMHPFVKNMEEDRTDAFLSNLNHSDLMLQTALLRDDLFMPSDGKGRLTDIEPHYEILFDIAPQAKKKSKITQQLHVLGHYHNEEPVVDRQWTRFTDRARAGQVLEIFMIQFDGGLSWKLQVDAANRPSNPADGERDFATSVQLLPYDSKILPMSPTKLRFKWRPNIDVRAVRQKTVWRFAIQPENRWIVEIARYDDFVEDKVTREWSPGQTRWDASVHHRAWSVLSSAVAVRDQEPRIGGVLQPDDNECSDPEAIKKFCMMLNQISDILSI